jgi:hypothetical protein
LLRATAFVIGGLVLALAACWVLFVVAMRTKFPAGYDRVRRMNRAVVNPAG